MSADLGKIVLKLFGINIGLLHKNDLWNKMLKIGRRGVIIL
jgi:hypothetical protein